jgi:hypothetical protein
MQTALRTRIKDNTAAEGRVDWGLRPQAKDLPAIRLTLVSRARDYTMAGADGTQMYRVQADCHASTYRAAVELGDALIALLEPVSGSFQPSFVLLQRDVAEQLETGAVHNRSIDFQITYVSA